MTCRVRIAYPLKHGGVTDGATARVVKALLPLMQGAQAAALRALLEDPGGPNRIDFSPCRGHAIAYAVAPPGERLRRAPSARAV
jgi:hypothetical protein